MAPLQRMIVAVTGASGALYAVRLLKAGLELGLSIDLVVSDYGKRLLIEECDLNLKTLSIEGWLDRNYGSAERPGRPIRSSTATSSASDSAAPPERSRRSRGRSSAGILLSNDFGLSRSFDLGSSSSVFDIDPLRWDRFRRPGVSESSG